MYNPFKVENDKVKINFSLFRNDRREKETHPQATSWDKETGLSASAWTRATKTGDKYQSCVVEFPLDVMVELLKDHVLRDQPQAVSNEKVDDDLPW